VLLTAGVWRTDSQRLITTLARGSAGVMLKHGIADGTVSFRSDSGWTFRTARLSGTADPATRAAVSQDLATMPGIHSVEWVNR
jgi:hypothetical protein